MEINSTRRYRSTRAAHHVTRSGQAFSGPARLSKPLPASKVYTGPDAVICGTCGASVKPLTSGRASSHSAGGYPVSIKRGMYNCEGTGYLNPIELDSNGNEIDKRIFKKTLASSRAK